MYENSYFVDGIRRRQKTAEFNTQQQTYFLKFQEIGEDMNIHILQNAQLEHAKLRVNGGFGFSGLARHDLRAGAGCDRRARCL